MNPDAGKFLKQEIEFIAANGINLADLLRHEVDVVFTSNFLEHLPDKKALTDFLDQVWAILAPGGRYLIMGPNLRYAPGQYWDAFDHYLGLTHMTFIEALELKGFSIRICIDRFLPYTTKWALPTHPWLVWLYLALPFVWPLLGRQFFIIAEKTADNI